ncbi:MAG: hypothetical protein HY735_28710 [Verrucomicrobia bacterium]|nr:hypothetical protein [Verrucomicrobiota bacterium]
MKADPRPGKCEQIAQWAERVEVVPRGWFAALTESPLRLPLEKLPFGEAERAHLAACPDCQRAAMEALEQRAQLRWMVLCPETGEISAWLRCGPDAALEAHLRGCALCAGQAKRTAWLAQGANLLSREQVEAKLRAIAAGPETIEGTWEAFVTWLVEHFWFAEEERQAISHVAAGWRLVAGGRRAAQTTKEELKTRLAGDETITLARQETDVRWLLAKRVSDGLEVQAGRSVAEKCPRFRLVFRRGDEVIHEVTTGDGRLRLTAADLARAVEADAFEIESLEG